MIYSTIYYGSEYIIHRSQSLQDDNVVQKMSLIRQWFDKISQYDFSHTGSQAVPEGGSVKLSCKALGFPQ